MHPGQPSTQITIGLVQINNSFSGQNYLPYSVGLLQAYVQHYAQDRDRYHFRLPIYSRLSVEQAVQNLLGTDVVAFSTYVWNIRLSLEIAKRLKTLSPETLILFGGPQVPDRAEAFLRQNPFIDLCCHGEGEQVFLAILETLPERNWTAIPSISFLQGDQFIHHPKGERIKEIDEIPSPYLSGVFEPLMQANPQEQWLVLWETNRGCPFSCTYCDWGSAVQGKVYRFDLDRLFQEIDWFAQHQIEFIFCCDANFGILPRDLDLVHYVVQTKEKYGYPRALSVQNTKNATERAYEVQKLLADSGLNKGVTIAMQSLDPNALKNIRRQNISIKSFQELQHRFTQDNVETYTDLILGLPGETYETFVNGISMVIENGQHNRIQFNNLSILPNAEMGDPDYQKRYGMETIESKVVNIHGSLITSADEIYETQQLVIGTHAMPQADWRKTRAFCWMAALLHFDKVLQIPLILLHEICGVGYRELLERFTASETLAAYPTLSEIWQFFLDKAEDIQNGGAEYCCSEEWLNIWWPADEYILIRLSIQDKLNAFYQEAEANLSAFLEQQSIQISLILQEAIVLNHALLKQPFQTDDLSLHFSHNIWEFYQAARQGIKIPLENYACNYHIDRTSQTWQTWEDWCQKVIWYGNKKGAYLYPAHAISSVAPVTSEMSFFQNPVYPG
jgi:radical SAM superfamily enzyme YgiQ (UPF0313 family)